MESTLSRPFSGTYSIDRAHSSVQFAVAHIVSTFRASFEDVEGCFAADDRGATLTARARVESVSISDPPEFREHVVRGEDFFAADAYPELTFSSTEVELRPDGTAVVGGLLTIRGISRNVCAAGTYRPPTRDPLGIERIALQLSATVDRRAWDLNWQLPLPEGGDAVGWDVEVTAELELVRAD
jgi:polyisoprenoid-binding protein YceI